MDYLNHVNDNFPMRRTDEQKEKFRNYILDEAQKNGRDARVEMLEGKHGNLIIGDPHEAEVLVTAHYDTPAASLVPNLMMPRNPLLSYLYAFGFPILLAMLSLLAAYGVQALLSLPYEGWEITYILLYLGSFWLCTRAFTNKHNKNDNTSGVAAVLSLMSKTKNPQVAFILFDNEEKGLLGSKAYAKAHKAEVAGKLVINLDCVGLGENILTVAKKDAEAHPLYSKLTEAMADGDGFTVCHFPKKCSVGNSDYKNFPCGVGVMACKKSKSVGYYTPYIHTSRDTAADSANIDFIADKLADFAEKI